MVFVAASCLVVCVRVESSLRVMVVLCEFCVDGTILFSPRVACGHTWYKIGCMAVPNPRVYVRIVVDIFYLCANNVSLFGGIGAEGFVVTLFGSIARTIRRGFT